MPKYESFTVKKAQNKNYAAKQEKGPSQHMPFQQISENSFLFETVCLQPSLTASSLIYHLGNQEVVLLDTGCSVSQELFDELDKRHWHVCAALCTHIHWDHTANNAKVVELGGSIYVHTLESETKHPPNFHYTYPITYIAEGRVSINGQLFEFVHTPGHTPGHCAIITPDNICLAGDAVMAEEELTQSKFPFMEDAKAAIASMAKIRNIRAEKYVVSHNGLIPSYKIDTLIDANIKKEIEIYDSIRNFITPSMNIDEFPEQFITSLNISITHAEMIANAKWRLLEMINSGELKISGSGIISLNI